MRGKKKKKERKKRKKETYTLRICHSVTLRSTKTRYPTLSKVAFFFYDASPNSVAVLRVTGKNSCNRHTGIIDLECYKV